MRRSAWPPPGSPTAGEPGRPCVAHRSSRQPAPRVAVGAGVPVGRPAQPVARVVEPAGQLRQVPVPGAHLGRQLGIGGPGAVTGTRTVAAQRTAHLVGHVEESATGAAQQARGYLHADQPSRPGRPAVADRRRYRRRGRRRTRDQPVAPVAVARRRDRLGDGGRRTAGRERARRSARGAGVKGAWRVADVRVAEQDLMARLPEGTLMQRAAAGLARRTAQLLGGVYGARILLLVGSGDNGGDALFAGARLARRGARVSALLLSPERAHRAGLAALRAAGGRTTDEPPSTVDVVLDGIVGIGGKGGLRPEAAAVVEGLGDATVVAVDVPSGVDADTGAVPGAAVDADVTVTFGCLKPGLLVGAGAAHAGLVEQVDIGLAPRVPPALRVATRDDIRSWWPRPGRESDKYTRGVVGVATGSATYPGAAVLSVAGACAGPTGIVRYAGAAAEYVKLRHATVIYTGRVAEARRVQTWVCGSGLGTDA